MIKDNFDIVFRLKVDTNINERRTETSRIVCQIS